MSSPGWKLSNILLGKSGGQLVTIPERTKRLGQIRSECSVMDISGGESESIAVKNNIGKKKKKKNNIV